MKLKKFFLCFSFKTTLFLFLSLLFIILTGCKRKTDETEVSRLTPPLWTNEEGVVCVVLGYGFNSETLSEKIISSLSDNFGLSESGGLVLPLIFPDDFHGRISNLSDLLEKETIRGIVLLGAPEKSHSSLARLRDKWDDSPPFCVFSLFPQDDILGQESVCVFVLDRESKVEDDILSEDEEKEIALEDILSLLIPAVENAALVQFPPESDEEILSLVQGIVGKRVLARYTDSESGIQSVNHFILKESD